MSDNKNVTVDAATLEKLQAKIKAHNLKYLVPSYVDMHGIPKAKMVPVSYLERMMGGSELFTGAALDGVPQNMSDDEVGAVPDPESFMVVPWRDGIGWFASDLWYQGKPFEPCNRGILKRVLQQAADKAALAAVAKLEPPAKKVKVEKRVFGPKRPVILSLSLGWNKVNAVLSTRSVPQAVLPTAKRCRISDKAKQKMLASAFPPVNTVTI